MKVRPFFRSFPAIFALILSGTHAWAESKALCSNPRPGSVPLSFSIPSFNPGEFDLVCVDRIQRAVERGFTSVTITPKIAYDHRLNESLVGSTLLPGELTRCLESAWMAGLDVIYSPHIEDGTPGELPVWRAMFDLKPDGNYELAAYEEFLHWIGKHVAEVTAGPQRVRISLETELETSTIKHPELWRDFTQSIRKRLASIGLEGKVPLGVQPNWYPVSNPDVFSCVGFRDWIASLDFVSPSMYGDWSQIGLGEAQVSSRVATVLSALERKGHFLCEVPEFRSKPYGFGEIGVGVDLVHTERTGPLALTDEKSFIQQRRQIYANLFEWMRTQSSFSPGYPVINIWAYGLYDPTGLDRNSTVLADDEIVRDILDYKAWRCVPSDLPQS